MNFKDDTVTSFYGLPKGEKKVIHWITQMPVERLKSKKVVLKPKFKIGDLVSSINGTALEIAAVQTRTNSRTTFIDYFTREISIKDGQLVASYNGNEEQIIYFRYKEEDLTKAPRKLIQLINKIKKQ